MRSYIWQYEDFLKRKSLASSCLYDRNISQSLTLFDLSGFNLGLWNNKIKTILKFVLSLTSNMYPETLFKLFILNAPMVFSGVFTLIKGWLDEKTK